MLTSEVSSASSGRSRFLECVVCSWPRLEDSLRSGSSLDTATVIFDRQSSEGEAGAFPFSVVCGEGKSVDTIRRLGVSISRVAREPWGCALFCCCWRGERSFLFLADDRVIILLRRVFEIELLVRFRTLRVKSGGR